MHGAVAIIWHLAWFVVVYFATIMHVQESCATWCIHHCLFIHSTQPESNMCMIRLVSWLNF